MRLSSRYSARLRLKHHGVQSRGKQLLAVTQKTHRSELIPD